MSYNAPPKKNPNYFAGIIGAVIGIFVVRTYVFPTKSIDEGLREVSIMINKTTPKMLDEVTRLDATYSGPGNLFHYNLTIIGHQTEIRENKEALRKWAESHATENYKTRSEMAAMRDLGTVLSYHYTDEAGAPIFDIDVDPKKF